MPHAAAIIADFLVLYCICIANNNAQGSGVFMIYTQLADSSHNTLANSSRAAFLPYTSPMLKAIRYSRA
jgi:Putative adipose-regulatory protein (Seipin)